MVDEEVPQISDHQLTSTNAEAADSHRRKVARPKLEVGVLTWLRGRLRRDRERTDCTCSGPSCRRHPGPQTADKQKQLLIKRKLPHARQLNQSSFRSQLL